MTTTRPLAGIQLYNFDVPVPLDHVGDVVRDLSVEVTFAPLNWGSVERDAGVFDWGPLEWWDLVAERVDEMPSLIWTLYPVHMNERGPLPADLRKEAFDAPQMIERFDAFVAEAARRAGWGAHSIVMVGNEIDMWADAYPHEVESWLTFSDAAATSIRTNAPGARVVNSLTNDAVVHGRGGGQDFIDAINRSADLVAFQWYDHDPDLRIRELSNLDEVVDRWVKAASGKPVLISEIGLATGAGMGSSEQLQVQRIEELFDLLAARPASEIAGAIWLGLDDWDPERLRQWIRHQFPTMDGYEPFHSFLTTLGLRTYDGTPKPGYDTWARRAAAHRRG